MGRTIKFFATSVATTVAIGFSAESRAESIGHYAAGKQTESVAMPTDGPDHYLQYPGRCYRQRPYGPYSNLERADNFYGQPQVVKAIQDVAAELRKEDSSRPRLVVGELSNARGGRIAHHLSHQTGLDVDILYIYRDARRPKDPVRVCGSGRRFEVKTRNVWQVRPDFPLEDNWRLVEAFAKRKDVRTILIGTLVRKALLDWAKDNVPKAELRRTKRKLNPVFCRAPRRVNIGTYRNNWCPHDDHIHVRFHCAKTDKRCRESKRSKRSMVTRKSR